jgi:PAS domain S-box-containing protein
MDQEIKIPKDMIIVTETDAKGIIKFANEDFCKIAGYSLDELLDQPHSKVRHPDMPKAAFADLWQTIQGGEIWKGIVKNKTKNGGYYWVNATAYPSKTTSNELRYISVRVRPTNEEIANAIELYSTLK